MSELIVLPNDDWIDPDDIKAIIYSPEQSLSGNPPLVIPAKVFVYMHSTTTNWVVDSSETAKAQMKSIAIRVNKSRESN